MASVYGRGLCKQRPLFGPRTGTEALRGPVRSFANGGAHAQRRVTWQAGTEGAQWAVDSRAGGRGRCGQLDLPPAGASLDWERTAECV